MSERLQKVLSRMGVGSRRQIEGWIAEGRIHVNGQVAIPGTQVEGDEKILLDGKPFTLRTHRAPRRVICYYKPTGEVTTRSDPEGRATIFDRLPELRGERWVVVGRLDINTQGLLILTTDGELAHRLMHPSREIEREYAVRVLGEVREDILTRLKSGVMLEDGMAKFDTLEDRGGEGANHWYHVTLKEGRKHEVRRLWASQNIVVSRLIRVRYGNFSLGRSLRPGQWRDFNKSELNNLLQLVDLPPDLPQNGFTQEGFDQEEFRPRARRENTHSDRDGRDRGDRNRGEWNRNERDRFARDGGERREQRGERRSFRENNEERTGAFRPRSDRPHSNRSRSDRSYSDRPQRQETARYSTEQRPFHSSRSADSRFNERSDRNDQKKRRFEDSRFNDQNDRNSRWNPRNENDRRSDHPQRSDDRRSHRSYASDERKERPAARNQRPQENASFAPPRDRREPRRNAEDGERKSFRPREFQPKRASGGRDGGRNASRPYSSARPKSH